MSCTRSSCFSRVPYGCVSLLALSWHTIAQTHWLSLPWLLAGFHHLVVYLFLHTVWDVGLLFLTCSERLLFYFFFSLTSNNKSAGSGGWSHEYAELHLMVVRERNGKSWLTRQGGSDAQGLLHGSAVTVMRLEWLPKKLSVNVLDLLPWAPLSSSIIVSIIYHYSLYHLSSIISHSHTQDMLDHLRYWTTRHLQYHTTEPMSQKKSYWSRPVQTIVVSMLRTFTAFNLPDFI